MKYGGLILEKKEYVLLKRFLSLSGYHKESILQPAVKNLLHALDTAIIQDENNIPSDVIRFNSVFTVTSEGGWQKRFQLVIPTHSDLKSNRLSILTPMGTAVIGRAEKDHFLWEFPLGKEGVTITEVQQSHSHLNIDVLF